jgi:hypothetical protein
MYTNSLESIQHRKTCRWHRNNPMPFVNIFESLYEGTLALGTSARSGADRGMPSSSVSVSTAASNRKRGRSGTQTLDVGGKSSGKKPRGEEAILAAFERSVEARTSSVVKAIQILSKEYYDLLSEDDFGRATDTLTDEMKASVFVTLPLKEMRDSWLKRHANIDPFL